MQEKADDADRFQVLNLAGAAEFLGDAQAVSDLLQPLVTSLHKDIGEIEQALGQSDMPSVSRMLHSLKGFIPVFCYAEFADRLMDVERRSRSDTSAPMQAQVQALLQPLRQLLHESQRFLQQSDR